MPERKGLRRLILSDVQTALISNEEQTHAEQGQAVSLAALRTIQAVGHTGHDPARRSPALAYGASVAAVPFPVGCRTPVLGGPWVNFASIKAAKGSRRILQANYSRS